MRIAIIGAGIAGGAAAHALATGSRHAVTVYERDGRPGGHSLTVDVPADGGSVPVDLGFIVYNEATYPDFTRLLGHLGVETKRADMSFCLADRDGAAVWSSRNRLPLPYGGSAAAGLALARDVLRYNRAAAADLGAGRLEGALGAYLARIGVSERFRDDYLVPMAAAIWSMPPARILDLPARTFVAFFETHRLLRLHRPAWRTIAGGSRTYVERLAAPWRARMRPGAVRILRDAAEIEVIDAAGAADRFDALVLACHPGDALALLAEPTAEERAVLGAIRHRASDVVLHRDESLMPGRRDAWAAWTIRREPAPGAGPAVTYWMNLLQGLPAAAPLFVSLDPPRPPAESLTLARARMAHPQFDVAAIAAQARLPALQGARGTWFCGAWTAYGFHECGLRSGLDVAERLGAALPWRRPARAAA